jgi:hypothetical protein
MARVISGCRLSNCSHNVVFPPPDGAEMTMSIGV